jgi:hypothetical protein
LPGAPVQATPAPRTPLVRFAVPALALVVVAAAIAGIILVMRGGKSTEPARSPGSAAATAAAAAPSPPSPAPAATPSAAVPPRPAATPGAAPAASPDPAAAPPAARPVAREPRGARQTKDNDTPTTLLGAADQRKSECETITRPPKASTVPPARLVECWCELHDQARAQAVFAKLVDPHARDELRKLCAPRGVDLP